MLKQIDPALLEAASQEYQVLQTAFEKDLKRRYASDARIAGYVPILLDKVLRLEQLRGVSFATDEDGDDRNFVQGQKAIELLALVPEIPRPAKGDEIPKNGGFPTTRAALWQPIIRASVRGCSNDNIFTRALLKKVRLTESEQKSLRECLRTTLSQSLIHEPRLLSSLRYVTKRSEPLVVRAFLHAAASRIDDEYLIEFFAP